MAKQQQHKAVELAAVICGYARRKDRSVSIRIATQSEAPTDLIQWLDERQDRKEVTVLIADDANAQALSYQGERDKKGNSLSQQLRTALWSQHKVMLEHGVRNVPQEFADYYDLRMNEFIEFIKFDDC